MEIKGIDEVRIVARLAKHEDWIESLSAEDRRQMLEGLREQAINGASVRAQQSAIRLISELERNDLERANAIMRGMKLESELSEGEEDEIDFSQGEEG
jgi:hypothetical protein